MSLTSEVTIKDIWPKLCSLGLIELRINDRTVWSDSVLDCLARRLDYTDIEADYRKRAEEELLGDWYKNFRVTAINIKIVDFHHCVADVSGYYDVDEDDDDCTV